MTKTTLPLLIPTATIAADTIMIVRRNGQIVDESFTAALLQTYVNTNPAIAGGTINNNTIGGITPAAGTFTTVTASNVVTSQVKASGAGGVVIANSAGTTVGTFGASGVDVALAGALTLGTDLAITEGGTGASDAATARTNLGIGASGTHADAFFAQTANNLSDLANAGTARTNLGLGSIATQNANNVTITGGSVTGITDILVADGGTGSSTAPGARTNLGLAIGTDVQAQNAALQSIAGLTTAADTTIYTTALNVYATTALTATGRTLIGGASAAAMRTTLGLGTIATQDASAVTITGGSVTGITDITVADGGTGSSTAAGARTNLGLGTIATQDANNVTISGGSVTGIADIAIADGGTGASTAANARTNLGLVIGTDVQAFNSNLTTLTTSTAGDIFYASATNTIAKLAKGTALQILRMNSGATAPEWAAAAGSVVQRVQTLTGAVATGSTTTPDDDTIPQNTEGDQFMSLAITPTSSTNKLQIDVIASFASSASTNACVALFQDATANALAAQRVGQTAVAARGQTTMFSYFMAAGTTSATTFKVRIGPDSASTTTFNGTAAARRYGGVMASSISITEYTV